MNVIHHTIRGCRNLPGVGGHSGTVWLVIMIGISCLIGLIAGSVWIAPLSGMIVGFLVGSAIVVPAYLRGAYHRSLASDYYLRMYHQAPEEYSQSDFKASEWLGI